VVASTLRDGDVATGLASYLAYAAGMGLVVVLAGAIALVAGRRRASWGRRVHIGGGTFVVAAGAYLAWYGVYEVRLRSNLSAQDPIVDAAARVQAHLSSWVDRAGPPALAGALLVLLIGSALAARFAHVDREATPSGVCPAEPDDCTRALCNCRCGPCRSGT
jgi:hypothetical protein